VSAVVDYRSDVDDNLRWSEFPFRDGDIVVSTRSKHGTTWVQALCLMLIHGPDLPGDLADLSPWLDHRVETIEAVISRLERQPTRRVIKTHTPLDGLALDSRATYVVAARHPLDAAVSLYHQGNNIDRRRVSELTGAPVPTGVRPPLDEWLRAWIASELAPTLSLDGRDGVLHHVRDAWSRRHQDNVVLVHYADLITSLPHEVQRLADALGITVGREVVDEVVANATFERFQREVDRFVPNRNGVLIDRAAFFRRGRSGAAREVLTPAEFEHYLDLARERLEPDVFEWLHRE
jgi:aryl sulfotransferase